MAPLLWSQRSSREPDCYRCGAATAGLRKARQALADQPCNRELSGRDGGGAIPAPPPAAPCQPTQTCFWNGSSTGGLVMLPV
jgi:hypothetical protein